MINKNNIAKVLKHNNLKFKLYRNCIQLNNEDHNNTTVIDLDHVNLIPIIEAHIGRELEPLPEPNPFDAVKVGQWVKSKKTVVDYGCQSAYRTEDKWYQRVESERNKYFTYNSNISSKRSSTLPDEWDLTDIRDYNPEEEILLKVGDKIDLIDYTTDTNKGHVITKIDYFTREIHLYNHPKECCVYLRFDSAHKIESVNGRQGKFVIPPFDFEQTLLDAGFFKSDNVLYSRHGLINIIVGINTFYTTHDFKSTKNLKKTPANVKRMIDAAAILNNLELAK